ncbi:MAG: O-antigen ligase family protein [Patescibacteria group bacterium]|jgi:O-antigen ligase|nr:O-antigen ligase family protein [Patescibacteria group bacterium]
MNEKTYKLILQILAIFSLIFVFFVNKELLFPYITSKQFSFNILTELMFALWLVFILKFPKYRPRKNLITFGLLAYLLAITASLFVSVDPQLSFWGDAERMLGLFHVSHFFLFYLVIVSVFRKFKDWQTLLISSVVVATIVSLKGLMGDNTYSFIGNTAYVSGYLIFNLFFAAILFFRENEKKLRWIYSIPVIIMLLEFWQCKTSGAIIGLFLGILLTIFLVGLFHDNKKIKRLSLTLFALAIISVTFIFSQSQTTWFQNSFLKNLTPQKITFQTRLISWQAAAEDFGNHPMLGTGFGNFAVIFDKHFDSKFFNYTTSETYFDRAHNNLIDIASTTGLVGLITYLTIFIFALIYLFRVMKENDFKAGISDFKHRKNLEIILIVSLLAAYFIQNLAIFDSFVTYIGLMITLGYISWLYFDGKEREERKSLIKSQSLEIFLIILFLLFAYIFTANFNIRYKNDLKGAITGYSQMKSGEFQEGLTTFKESLNGGPLDRDARGILINLFTSNRQVLDKLPDEIADDYISYVIENAKKNVSHNSMDSLMNLQLTQVLDVSADYYKDKDEEMYQKLSKEATEAMEIAIKASPERAPLYFAKGQMLVLRGEEEKAIEVVEKGISFNREYYAGYCQLSQFYASMGKQNSEEFSNAFDKCLDLGGIDSIKSSLFLEQVVSQYVNEGDYNRSVVVAKRLHELNPENKDIALSLAKLYYLNSDLDKANEIKDGLKEKNEGIEEEWQSFIQAMNLIEQAENTEEETN